MAKAIGTLISFSPDAEETIVALRLGQKLSGAGRDLAKLDRAMDESWREIYHLADLVAARHLRTGPRAAFPEPTVERLLPAATTFDHEWKEATH